MNSIHLLDTQIEEIEERKMNMAKSEKKHSEMKENEKESSEVKSKEI
jgi:hypothetical protein